MSFSTLNKSSKLTNLEELSFFMVLAFPKASRMGLACRSCFSSSPWFQQQYKEKSLLNTNGWWSLSAVGGDWWG